MIVTRRTLRGREHRGRHRIDLFETAHSVNNRDCRALIIRDSSGVKCNRLNAASSSFSAV